MTIEELESACNASRKLDFSRHEIEGPELHLQSTIYPLGFPTKIRTNSPAILAIYKRAWGAFRRKFDIDPIQVDIHVSQGGATGCPPSPTYRVMRPLLISAADAENYSVADFSHGKTHIALTQAAMQHDQYVRYFFLESAPLVHVATRHATPVHASCVSLDGCGVLLCGDSGAGKSTLSYACARKGWTYTADDACYLVHGRSPTLVTGNCYQVRFRPAAAQFFPEIGDMKITPRAEGKPSVEVRTSSLPPMACSQTTEVGFMVFLNRRTSGPQELRTYRKDVAREFMRQTLYGTGESLPLQYEAIDRLLQVDVLELRYTDLDWAIERLRTLVQKGQ